MPPARALLYVATTAVFVLAGRAVFASPPSLLFALGALAAYLGIVLYGVFQLRARMFVDAMVRGPRGARGVVVTFDDGPDPNTTPKVLDVLGVAGVKAAFFVIGKKAEAHPELVREIAKRGHTIGLHSYAHDRLFALKGAGAIKRDLERGMLVLTDILGNRPTLFRPPVGHTNPSMGQVVHDLGLTVIGWTVRARDGLASTLPDDVVCRVRRGLRDGAIILLHDAAECGGRVPAGVVALSRVLDAVREARLEVVPIGGWL